MTTYDRIKKRARHQGFNNLQTVAEKAGIATNLIYSWKYRKPTNSSLVAVAKVLNTTTDFLNGLTDDPKPLKQEDATPKLDLKDNPVVLSYGGYPASSEDMEIIKAILKRHQDKDKKDNKDKDQDKK